MGRQLEYARNYALLIGAVLGSAVALDQAVAHYVSPDWLPRPWRLAASTALPFALALTLSLARRARPLGLYDQFAQVPSRYFRIGPYEDTESDRAFYQRTDGEHERVLNWLLRHEDKAVPMYLTGASGAGKSSLLQAYVLPKLRERGWIVVAARALDDPVSALRRALDAEPDSTEDVRGLIQRRVATEHAKRIAGDTTAEPPDFLVLLDQFEELFTRRETVDEARREAIDRSIVGFRDLLRDLAARPVRGLRVLLVMRGMPFAQIEATDLPGLTMNINWHNVPFFNGNEALKFLRRSGLGLSSEQMNRLLEGVAGLEDAEAAGIRPVTLNMVGYVLEKGRVAWGPGIDVRQLLQNYVQSTLSRRDLGRDAQRLLRGLVTELGEKRPRALERLARDAAVVETRAREVLLLLAESGLVRELGQGQDVWEPSHDFVARLLQHELSLLEQQKLGRLSRLQLHVRASIARASTRRRAGAEAAARRDADNHARRALRDLRFDLQAQGGGLILSSIGKSSDRELARAAPLLAQFHTRLVRADLGKADVSNISPLASLRALVELDLQYDPVEDLGPLAELAALTWLNLKDTAVRDLKPLAGLAALEWLDLGDTAVDDLAPLAGLTALQSLDIESTIVDDLAPLAGLTALTYLDIRGVAVSDLRVLENLPRLKYLRLNSPLITRDECDRFAAHRKAHRLQKADVVIANRRIRDASGPPTA